MGLGKDAVEYGGPMLVAISGIDCAGKSTQIALLRAALEAQGSSVDVRWFRPGYSPLLDAARRVIRRLRAGALPRKDDAVARERVFARPGVRRAWARIALVDALLQYVVLVRLSLLRRNAVICDRYVEDAILDLDLRFPDLHVQTWLLARALRALSPRPRLSVLLMLTRDEMLRRMAVKREPFPDAPEVRESRFEAYTRMAAGRSFEVVDGGRAVAIVEADVQASLARVSAR